MFNVFVNDGSQEMPTDDILYIVCKEGVYLKKNLGIMESITPVNEISILEPVEMMARMHIKPIPAYQFAQVESFFREVYKEHHSEAIVLLFYNEERKVYKIVPPFQKVSGAAVDYSRALTLEGYNMIGDIHSHANMSAFHSTIDDADEKSFDGLHITIGNCGSEQVSISASIVSNGQRFKVEPSDYINKLALTRDIDEEVERPYGQTYIWDKDKRQMVPKPLKPGEKQRTYTVKRFDKRYVVDVSKKYRKFDPKWMDLVEKKVYSYTYGTGAYGGSYWKNWRKQQNTRGYPPGKYDSHLWNQKNKDAVITAPGNKTPLLPAKTTKPVTFPPHTQSADGAHEEIVDNKDISPCDACVFRDHKINAIIDQITEENELPGEYDAYQCMKCSSLFSTPDDSPVCPNCKVDDYLMLVDDEDGDWEVVGEDTPDDIDWYRCDKCNHIFETPDIYPKCPKCKAEWDELVELQYAHNSDDAPAMEEKTYKHKCPHCASETDYLNDGNECPFCRQVVEDPIEEAGRAAEAMHNLSEAIKADEELERIPIPDQDHIPINKKPSKEKPYKGIFRSLFKKDKK